MMSKKDFRQQSVHTQATESNYSTATPSPYLKPLHCKLIKTSQTTFFKVLVGAKAGCG